MARAGVSSILAVTITLVIAVASAHAAEPAKVQCPKTAMCRRMRLPCETAPGCDASGRPLSMCWVKRPAGSSCALNGRTGKCSSGGMCTVFIKGNGTVPKSNPQGPPGTKPQGPNQPIPGQGRPINDIALCKPGTGGVKCAPCPAGTFSLGSPQGKECDKCPPHAMCLRMPTPCEEMPICDPTTGKVASMCWVKKPEGAACNPENPMAMPADTSDGKSYVCKAGECLPMQ